MLKTSLNFAGEARKYVSTAFHYVNHLSPNIILAFISSKICCILVNYIINLYLVSIFVSFWVSNCLINIYVLFLMFVYELTLLTAMGKVNICL